MHRPVLVTPAAGLPVSVEEAMRQCRITIDDGDDVALAEVTALLEGYIGAAVSHLEGWNGTLGGVVVIGEQVWKQEFDAFSQCLRLPLSPVASIESVTWRNSAGQIATISSSEYALKTDAAGVSVCRFRNSYSFPSDLYEIAAIAVTYKAGYTPLPKDIKQAILLLVGAWYENREETVIGVPVASLPVSAAVETLTFPYRRNII
ncbi:head-tail connector protein [Neorhizobium petrolearium]|uniref:Head-tail connector protein n=1 Tax=Neorhizobium petrolearium TaxID=515361 RepID=A0ABY8M4M5_9HYPH|nr:head-tail connector protein [Neorhizobium petrolearium]MCC2608385.1 head-tail connector protein [Neorhizobium petrolearium]WGI68664.1 head-tail connector protein [Neorhizobium petrolearium]